MTTDPTKEQTGALGSEQERVARIIYDRAFERPDGIKPAWVERGNAFKQDDARHIAREILASLSPQARPVLEREAVARIIDGFAFSPKVEAINGPDGPNSGWQDRRNSALAKADAIIALQSTRGEPSDEK